MSDSVLDRMTAGISREAATIMARKGKAASGLTPVAGETATSVAEIAGLAVPKDIPGALLAREQMAAASKDLRRMASELLVAADGLDVLLGVPEAVAAFEAKRAEVETKLAAKEVQRRADDVDKAAGGDQRAAKRVSEQEAFDAQLAAQAAAAQAAVFAASDAPAVPAGWVCPKHGDQQLITLTATKSGRVYQACSVGDCEEFQPK